MGLSTILRSAVSIADRITAGAEGVQVDVTHVPVRRTATGAPVVDTYGIPDRDTAATATRAGLWSSRSRLVQSPQGQVLTTLGTLTFLGSVDVHELDAITLPDGRTPAIAEVRTTWDAVGVVMTQVIFGASTARGLA